MGGSWEEESSLGSCLFSAMVHQWVIVACVMAGQALSTLGDGALRYCRASGNWL